jgi:redox-sensitive bicupin YhaK (pirin superfamily)
MSNISLIIEERPRDVGNFMVGRLLPFRNKRMVGPFIFIDHMGPATIGADQNFDVGPHPHIGLSTLTYLFEGSIMHRDTLGTEIEIKPGQVNWMTAGGGMVHSERTPQYLRHREKSMHGMQIWVALPKELEQMAPSFHHASDADLPHWQDGDLSYKLIAGEIAGHKSPVPVYSALYLLELKSNTRQRVNIGAQLYGECGLYILDGSIDIEGDAFGARELLVAKDSKLCEFVIEAGSTVYFFGGEPLPEPRLIYWNFVATDQSLIDAAKQKWRDQAFPKIKGETEFIPLPQEIGH